MSINYRAGFRRLYAVLVVCWVGLCAFMVISNLDSTPFTSTSLPEEMQKASFYRLPREEQRLKWRNVDHDFAGLPVTEQNKVMEVTTNKFSQYRRAELVSAFEIAAIPPICGYMALFVITPWASLDLDEQPNRLILVHRA